MRSTWGRDHQIPCTFLSVAKAGETSSLYIKLLDKNLAGVIGDVLQGGHWSLSGPTIPTSMPGLSFNSFSQPHTAWGRKTVESTGDPVSWDGDQNGIHKAMRKPDRRKYISEL